MTPQNPKVSILCNTYNHESYIAQAIDSFLMQKTDFPFEICIHDDASTDKTPDILRRYEADYPDRIKVIYQKENQFTKGHLIMEINSQRALGTYLAICDGDDCWTDPDKLQIQADLLDKNPDVSLIIHAYTQVSAHAKQTQLIQYYPDDRLLSLADLVEGPGRLYGYHTYMFRHKDLVMPDTFRILRFTDLPRLLYSACIGKVLYLKTPMALYRRGVVNSWSTLQQRDPSVQVDNQRRLQRFYQDLDRYTDHHYHPLIHNRLTYIDLLIAVRSQDRSRYKQLINAEEVSFLTPQQKKRLAHDLAFPRFFAWFRSMRMKYWR